MPYTNWMHWSRGTPHMNLRHFSATSFSDPLPLPSVPEHAVRDRIRGNTLCTNFARAFLACEVGMVVRGHEGLRALVREREHSHGLEARIRPTFRRPFQPPAEFPHASHWGRRNSICPNSQRRSSSRRRPAAGHKTGRFRETPASICRRRPRVCRRRLRFRPGAYGARRCAARTTAALARTRCRRAAV